jgi:hypothetical protein
MRKSFYLIILAVLVCSIASCGFTFKLALTATSTITHNECNSNNCVGAINVSQVLNAGYPLGYAGNYIYSDPQTGAAVYTSATGEVTGLCNGNYDCSINLFPNTPVAYNISTYTIGYNVNSWIAHDMVFDNITKTMEINNFLSNSPWMLSNNFLGANQDGYMTFEYSVASPKLGNVSIGFCEVNNVGSTWQDIKYGFSILTNNGNVAYSIVENGMPIALTAYKNPKQFKVERKGTKIYYSIDGKQVHYVAAPSNFSNVNSSEILRIKSTAYNNNLKVKNVSCSFCRSFNSVYASLNKDLDGTYYLMKNSILFKYKEKYNDVNLDYRVYNWKRELILSNNSAFSPLYTVGVTETNHEGVNYHCIVVNDKLEIDKYYVLEVTNNKGEVYKMRFRYDATPVKN